MDFFRLPVIDGSKFGWSNPVFILKYLIEVIDILVSHLFRNFINHELRLLQQLCSQLKPAVGYKIGKADAGIVFEKPAQVNWAHIVFF